MSTLLSINCSLLPDPAPPAFVTPLALTSAAKDSCADFVILVTVSSGYYDFFLNWLHYASKYLDIRSCLLAIAEDNTAMPLLLRELPLSSVIQGVEQGVGQTQVNGSMAFEYGGTSFGALVRRRPRHIASLLKNGTAVLYSDLDLIWTHNPLPTLLRQIRAPCASPRAKATDSSVSKWAVDIIAMNDEPENEDLACSPPPQAVHQLYLCTCFLFVAPTPEAIALIEQWDLRIQVKEKEMECSTVCEPGLANTNFSTLMCLCSNSHGSTSTSSRSTSL